MLVVVVSVVTVAVGYAPSLSLLASSLCMEKIWPLSLLASSLCMEKIWHGFLFRVINVNVM